MIPIWSINFLSVVICITGLGYSNGNVVQVSPSCRGNICEFDWTIDYTTTMVWFNRTQGTGYPVVPANGVLYKRLPINCTSYTLLTQSELREVITADGDYRQVYAINGQIPGPPIVVIEDMTVVVNVRNNLINEAITMHWHGIIQRGTPFMDGVSMVSQCPINSGQYFQYRFKADPVGTHWYHGHHGTTRSDGIAGPLIILPKPVLTPAPHVVQPTLHVDMEFYGLIQEWSRNSSLSNILELEQLLFLKPFGYNVNRCYRPDEQPDGTDAGVILFNAAILNGKGRRYPVPGLNVAQTPEIPLEVYTVFSHGNFRFRFINVAGDYPFRISIDAHPLHIVAFDGMEVELQTVDAVILAPAESVDFFIHAVAPINNYWIRIKTTATRSSEEIPIPPKQTFGILHYEGAPAIEPRTGSKICNAASPCVVANCNFGMYPINYHVICMPISAFKASRAVLNKLPPPIPSPAHPLQEFFLNFHFPTTEPTIRPEASINGKHFVKPTNALQTYPSLNGPGIVTPCDPAACRETCDCTHMIKLHLRHTIQMVLFINDTVPFRLFHPVHLHGHHFHVMKIGYPDYNPITGEFIRGTRDITCLTSTCSEATWTNPQWHGGNIPGLNLVDPPLKDTVSVPYGGYVVIRFVADNPGFWLMHCHLHIHLHDGMTLIMEEGDINEMPPIPHGFPTCPVFSVQAQEFEEYISHELARQQSLGLIGSHNNVGHHMVQHQDQTCIVAPWVCQKYVR